MNTDAHSLEFHLADEEATSELGARLARALDSVKSEILEKGLNIKLVGDLGAGKIRGPSKKSYLLFIGDL